MSWLRQRRDEIGLKTQGELAMRLQRDGYSVTRATISHWENDRYAIPLDDPRTRQTLARVLKLTEPELLARAGYDISTNHTPQGERAAAIIDSLPESDRERALRVIEAMF